MTDVIICNGFSGYTTYEDKYALESPFLLYKDKTYCDIPGLYKTFVKPDLVYQPTDADAPPYVCYVLKQMLHNRGFSSEMVFYLDFEKERMKRILSEKHQVIFLTTTLIPVKEDIKRAVHEIRQYAPDSIIICGGAFVDSSFRVRQKIQEGNILYKQCENDYFFNDTGTEDTGIDLFIFFDPDLQCAEQVLRTLKKGASLTSLTSTIPNLAYNNGTRWFFSQRILPPSQVLPIIDWQIFSSDEIRYSVPISYSKGCPNHCSYCSFHSLTKRSEKNRDAFAAEISTLTKHHPQAQFLYFCDDNICGNKLALFSTIQTLQDLNLQIPWGSFMDARFINEILAEKLIKTRCRYLKIGMESCDDSILANMEKPCRKKHCVTAANALSGAGISFDAFFIVGFPGEDGQTIKNTIDTINSFNIPQQSASQYMFFPFILAPLSPMYESEYRQKFGLSGSFFNWQHATMNRKEANQRIPEIVSQIHTMQPYHGSVEKALILNSSLYAQIDQTRGALIRAKAANSESLDTYWNKLGNLTRLLKMKNTYPGNPPLFE